MRVAQWRWHEDLDLTPLWGLWSEAAESGGQSFFQRPEPAQEWLWAYAPWVRPRIRYCAGCGAIVPWVQWGERLITLGAGMFDYCDAIGAPSVAALRAAAEVPREVPGLRADSSWAAAWRALAPDWGAPRHCAPFLAAGLGAEELDCRHPKAAERLRRIARQGAWGAVTDPSSRAALLEWLLRQKQERMQALGRDNVLGAPEAAWLRRMVARYPQFAELWRGEIGGRCAAGFLTWRGTGVRYGYLLAFAPEFARFSPGVLLLYHVLRECQREGREMDFLTGDQPFKLRFAAGRRDLFHLRLPAAQAGQTTIKIATHGHRQR